MSATRNKNQMQEMLRNAINITETSMEMKEHLMQGERYVRHLRTATNRASKHLRSLHTNCNHFLLMAHRTVSNGLAIIENSSNLNDNVFNVKSEYETLLTIIEKELCHIDDSESKSLYVDNADRIKYLQEKQNNVPQSCSAKSFKCDVDEKYPENLSRESLIDRNSVVSLPPVPEDAFTCFANKTTSTSSLSSLKGLRKVKLFLQRAANNSDDDDSSELDDVPDLAIDAGDKAVIAKLDNITEET